MAQHELKLTVEELIAKNVCPVKSEYVRPYRSRKTHGDEAALTSEHVAPLKHSRKRQRQVRRCYRSLRKVCKACALAFH
jgi:hypothetical protein